MPISDPHSPLANPPSQPPFAPLQTLDHPPESPAHTPVSPANFTLDVNWRGEQNVILGERWPTLRRAMGRYSERVAEEFSQKAYEHVEGGIIRQDARRELSLAAKEMEIREFDAQLLIACAVRKWGMDRRYDSSPSPEAPRLSAEYRAWGRVWKRIAIVFGMAVAVDGIIIWKMFS